MPDGPSDHVEDDLHTHVLIDLTNKGVDACRYQLALEPESGVYWEAEERKALAKHVEALAMHLKSHLDDGVRSILNKVEDDASDGSLERLRGASSLLSELHYRLHGGK
jgi:hypothetical protein